jgi:hypothetical protein
MSAGSSARRDALTTKNTSAWTSVNVSLAREDLLPVFFELMLGEVVGWCNE